MSHDWGLNSSPQPVYALILDAHLKSSLAAIRSLGAKGIPICAGSHRGTAMGLYSHYVTKEFIYPSPLEDRFGFVGAINQQIKQLGRCALFAFSDSTLLPLVDNNRLSSNLLLNILPPSLSDFHRAFDKGCTAELAQSIEVEIPKTFLCHTILELEETGRKMSYPVVLKPRKTMYWSGNSGIQMTSVFALSAEDLKAKFNKIWSRTGEPPLLQEYVKGEETGVEFLCLHGRILAACAHRRVRSASPIGGSGVVCQTVPLDYCGTRERAERLAATLQWSGPIMVEFKICQKTGIPHLMEINGRFWGSLPLATAAGVDFPYLYYQLACGQPVPDSMEYKAWLISRHFWGDFTNLCSALFRRDPMREVSYPHRSDAIKAFLSSSFRYTPAVFDRKDVKPSFAETIDMIRVITKKRFFTADIGRQAPEPAPDSKT